MSKCQRCSSERIMTVCSHGKDMHNYGIGAVNECGYLPYDIGLDGGDDLRMSFCLDCGQIQGTFPLPLTELEGATDE